MARTLKEHMRYCAEVRVVLACPFCFRAHMRPPACGMDGEREQDGYVWRCPHCSFELRDDGTWSRERYGRRACEG